MDAALLKLLHNGFGHQGQSPSVLVRVGRAVQAAGLVNFFGEHPVFQMVGLEQVAIEPLESSTQGRAALTVHASGTVVAMAGAVAGELDLLRAGGALLAIGAAIHLASLVHIVVAPHTPTPHRLGPEKAAAP